MSAAPEMFERLRVTEDKALRNELNLASHERECAIRYGHINEGMSKIQHDFRAVATAGAGVMLTVLGFLIKLVFFP